MNRERSGASHDPRRRVPRHWQLLARYHPPGWHLEFNPIRFSPDGSSRSATCDTTGHVSPDGTTIALDRAGGETHHSGPRLQGIAAAMALPSLRVIAAKIIRPRLRPREAARRQPAVRWAAAPIAVSRLGRDHGVEEAAGRRPGARRPYAAGPPRIRRGSVAARRPRAAPGGGEHRAAKDPMKSTSKSLT